MGRGLEWLKKVMGSVKKCVILRTTSGSIIQVDPDKAYKHEVAIRTSKALSFNQSNWVWQVLADGCLSCLMAGRTCGVTAKPCVAVD